MSTDADNSISSIMKGAGIIFSGIIGGSLIGLLNQILMARILGPNDYGLFNLGLSIMVIFCILPRFGLSSGLTQFIPYNITKGRFEKVKSGITFTLGFGLVSSLIASSVLFVLSGYISENIFHKPEIENVLKVLCLALPFWVLSNNLGSLMQAFKKPKYYVLFENILTKTVLLTIFIVCAALGYKLLGILFAYLCSLIFLSAVYSYLLFQKIYPSFDLNNSGIKRVSVRKELLSISFPLFLAGFTFLFMEYTDRLLLGVYMTPSDIGVYAAAFTIANLILFIFTSFSYNFRPVISEYFAVEDLESMKKIYSSVTKWIFLLTFPALVYIFFYSRDIIRLIYGEQFIGGAIPLTILTMGIAMNGLTGLTGEILISIKKTRLNLLTEIIGAGFNVGLNVLLIPAWGLAGAAGATSLSIALKNLFSLLFVYRELRIHPYTVDFIKIILASVLTISAINLFFKRYMYFEGSFLVAIPLFLIFYAVILASTNCFDEGDKRIIKQLIKKVRK